ncbi:MAG TPA: hypothetical protein VN685_07685 [Rhizomicrobium sp.]|nr:hypothetical protein [Rhizomicrobium sp.]
MKKGIATLSVLMLAGCAARERAPSPTRAVPIPAPPPAREPDVFTGLEASQLRALAGTPAFTRKDGATEMWRYDTQSCRAFFFFTGAPPKVQHVETLPTGKNNEADPACLNALRVGRP